MSAEQDKVRSIAERVASRLGGADRGERDARGGGEGGDDVAQLRDALREMQQRLAQIESRVGSGDAAQRPQREEGGAGPSPPRGQSPPPRGESQAPRQLMSTTYVPATHPSQERFGIDDAVTELVDFFESEKVCGVEPGKTCDRCAMCSTRGF